jgi:hypothetical protein
MTISASGLLPLGPFVKSLINILSVLAYSERFSKTRTTLKPPNKYVVVIYDSISVIIYLLIKILILDHRTHPTSSLLHPYLECCQGPALLAYNDGTFEEEDWRAIQEISNSSKKADTSCV